MSHPTTAAGSGAEELRATSALDLRTTCLGAAAWAGALLGTSAGGIGLAAVLVAVLTAVLLAGAMAWRRRRLVGACLVTAAAVAGMAGVRAEATTEGPVAAFAKERAVAEAVLVVRSDPVLRSGRFGDYVVARSRLRSLVVRGTSVRSSVPVLVVGGKAWRGVELGSVVRWTARLGPAQTAQEAAVLSGDAAPEVLRGPSSVLRGAAAVRAAVRRAAGSGPPEGSALVPALVTGDDQQLPEAVTDDFRTAGLTHLTAVSGTNLTLVLAFLLLLARWCGIRGRGHLVVGLCGVVGFVLLARPEPSVVRAAAMGTVALLGLGTGGRATGVRALGAAVLVLLVVDPWLAVSPGFALSVLATAGILFVAPAFRDALATWMPRPLAEAVAVPLAAQLACTPLVAALSGEVSLVAVAANLVAAPVVGPATVLGLAAGLVVLVLPPAGQLLGWLASWAAEVIVVVAHRAAELPVASVGWPTGHVGLAVLTVLCVGLTVAATGVLRSRTASAAVTALCALVVIFPLPSPGWPPDGWVMVMCDVGQGDAVVVRTGEGEGVVVDAGPDPALVDACLRRLGVDRIPAVVLTHFHADHVDGLPGVLRGRSVGEVEVDALRLPADAAQQVDRWAAAEDVPIRVPAYGERVTLGEVTWQVVAPRRILSDSPNDASVVLLVETHGLRVLLTGDVEPTSQAALLREPLGPVDVLKVPHHGSRYQDRRLLGQLGARVALVSAGADNDYGHPDEGTLAVLEAAGALVRRTDRHGDIAVVVHDGRLRVVTRR